MCPSRHHPVAGSRPVADALSEGGHPSCYISIYHQIVCISAPVFDSTISILFFRVFFSFHIIIFYIPRIIGTPLSADGSDVHAV